MKLQSAAVAERREGRHDDQECHPACPAEHGPAGRRLRRLDADGVVIVEGMLAPAGSSVIYLGSTIHGAGTNRTAGTWRHGVHLSYTLGWLRTEENNYLAVPPAVARTLPVLAQEILGYAVHDAIADAGGYLGMVQLRDPMAMLASGGLS
ncbi:MAG TPA: hypothetical protein VGH66_05390 [Acidimicrobiales bacterium]